MLFKGTRRRSARQIAESLESVGGSLNGFTSREQTCYHARILDEHVPLALDVLSDLVLNPRMDAREVEREKLVVSDEIRDLIDSPSEYVDERIASLIWRNNAIGSPIGGTVETVSGFTTRRLRSWLRGWYRPEKMVLAAAGNLQHGKFTREVEKAFRFSDHLPRQHRRRGAFQPAGRLEIITREGMQLHISLGGLAYPYDDVRKYALLILNSVLGEGMSSRLFQNLRERKGLAYAIHSYLALASDVGLFSVYLATEPRNGSRAVRGVLRELDGLREQGLSRDELVHAKAQLKGRLMLELENMSARMMRLAQHEILLGRTISLDETIARIEEVTADQVHEIARDLFKRKKISLAVVGPARKGTFRLEDIQA
jgi:predicted Zn-dependent peptidase